jgi:hypothetical protein
MYILLVFGKDPTKRTGQRFFLQWHGQRLAAQRTVPADWDESIHMIVSVIPIRV